MKGVSTLKHYNQLNFLLLSILFLINLFSCDSKEGNVSFDAPFPKKSKDLSLIIGDKFTLISELDTQTIIITYDKKTKLNLLKDATTGDTISVCRVSKFRQLYYFSEQLNDTSYMVYAVKIKEGEINGLGKGYFQMNKLYTQIKDGKYKELIKYYDENRDFYYLTFEKKRLKTFYKNVLDSLPSLRIANVIYNKNTIHSSDTIPIGTTKESLEESASIVKNVFPNPATDKFNIEFEDEGNYSLSLYNIEGNFIKTAKGLTNKLSIDVSDIASGTYIITVTEKESGEMTNAKLLVQH